jgi:hypothetical protein
MASGKDGRVLKEDILKFVEDRAAGRTQGIVTKNKLHQDLVKLKTVSNWYLIDLSFLNLMNLMYIFLSLSLFFFFF